MQHKTVKMTDACVDEPTTLWYNEQLCKSLKMHAIQKWVWLYLSKERHIKILPLNNSNIKGLNVLLKNEIV